MNTKKIKQKGARRMKIKIVVLLCLATLAAVWMPIDTVASEDGDEFNTLIFDKAMEYGVDPNLVKGLMKRENSAFDPNVERTNPQGDKDQGLMQLNNRYSQWMWEESGGSGTLDPFNPEQNIQAGTWYLDNRIKNYGDWEVYPTAYQNGVSAYNRGTPTLKNQGYVNDVADNTISYRNRNEFPGEYPQPPIPELPTVVLFSVGLIVLAGFVWLNSRKSKKRWKK
jgi:soluble lytic murein transglycosylase-like protein